MARIKLPRIKWGDLDKIKHTKNTVKMGELYGGLFISINHSYYVTSYDEGNNIKLTEVSPTCGSICSPDQFNSSELATICRIEKG